MSHSINPPLELVMQWSNASPIQSNDENWAYELFIADQASKWAADQELEACCELLNRLCLPGVNELRAVRRPKPPSLKDQALDQLHLIQGLLEKHKLRLATVDLKRCTIALDTISRALEQLSNDEHSGIFG
jgi:hypothetical protein